MRIQTSPYNETEPHEMGRLGSFSHASGRGKLYFATLRDGEKKYYKKKINPDRLCLSTVVGFLYEKRGIYEMDSSPV